MKLAEALMVRSDLQKKLYSLQSRLNKNVLVQEGDEPSEDPVLLLGRFLMFKRACMPLSSKFTKPMPT